MICNLRVYSLAWYILLISPYCLGENTEDKKLIRIALAENFQPYYYQDENGVFQGASFEISETVLKNLGYQTQITQFPSMKVALREIELGNQDLNVNLTITPEREKIARFTQTPHIFETQNIIVRADSSISYSGSLDELTDYRIGINYGWTYGPEFDRNKKLDRVYVNNSPEQLRNLLSGRFDIAINNPQFFSHLAKDVGAKNGFKILTPEVYALPVNMAVSRKYFDAESLITKLNHEIARFKKSSQYKQILKKYGFTLKTKDKGGNQ